ncbi:hypothetical protein GCM10017688_39320 [Streptomyces ramulosus]
MDPDQFRETVVQIRRQAFAEWLGCFVHHSPNTDGLPMVARVVRGRRARARAVRRYATGSMTGSATRSLQARPVSPQGVRLDDAGLPPPVVPFTGARGAFMTGDGPEYRF